MKDIFKEIKEIQKASEMNEKEAKFYKDRFIALRDGLKNKLKEYDKITNELFELMSEKRGAINKKRSDGKEYIEIADELYTKMILENKKIETVDIATELDNREMCSLAGVCSKVRQLIREKPGVKQEKQGLSIFLYCEQEDDDVKKRRIELAKQMGNIVEKTVKEEVGEIDFIDLGDETKIEKHKKYKAMR